MTGKFKKIFLYLFSKNSAKRQYLYFKIKDTLKTFYIYHKSKKRIIESGVFDEWFYLQSNPDVRQSDIRPIKHFILYGRTEGRAPNAGDQLGGERLLLPNRKSIHKPAPINTPEINGLFGTINHYPLVSIVSVNYNGADDLPSFFKSLLDQSYKNFELIIVDNNSSDQSEEIINEFQSRFTALKFIKLFDNYGFADGNNHALPQCQGELIALLNIDTKVDQNWLKELVDAVSSDAAAAAVTSKTLFMKRFQDVEISTDDEFIINTDAIEKSLVYIKYFIRCGNKLPDGITSVEKRIVLSLPVQNRKIKILFDNLLSHSSNHVKVKIGKNAETYYTINLQKPSIELDFSEESCVNSTFIINNAGSEDKNGMPADRGIGEYDRGQYDQKIYVDYFCGCSVLLRRSAIVSRKIFVPEFFAYFEDSELSRWLTQKGYKILYAPRSVVYHRHSATSSEGSNQWKMLVERSRGIFTYNGNVKELEIILNHNKNHYREKVASSLYHSATAFNGPLLERLKRDEHLIEPIKSVGIYNSYWKTMGGGEKHALYFANILQRHFPVYLISEHDFDLNELASYFGIDLTNCRKIIEPWISEEFTKNFYIFINSTFQSNLNSYSPKSYYIVSFPHKNINRKILETYHFLYNSDYTRNWARTFWGDSPKGSVLYPIGGLETFIRNSESSQSKQKIILSVGRFFVGGHSKNQHFIAKAFRQLNQLYKGEVESWKLVLIGSLNRSSYQDVTYYKAVASTLQGLNYEIIVNASRYLLEEYYTKSFLYIHATGYGQDPNLEPENFEHFGIAPIEAMLNDCYPIVYYIGGPADILKITNVGETFADTNELVRIMYQNIQKYNSNQADHSHWISEHTKMFIENNSLDVLINELVLLGEQ